MPKTLPPDASFEDVVPTLPDARRYLASVYQLMVKAEKDRGGTQARIGITGMGIMPNFRIETEDGTYKQAFDGVRFVPFTEPKTRDGNWSTRASNLTELKALAEEQATLQRQKSR